MDSSVKYFSRVCVCPSIETSSTPAPNGVDSWGYRSSRRT